MAKSIKNMAPMERWTYVTTHSKVCPCCNKEKRLTSFWDKINNPTEISKFCRPCSRKKYEADVIKVVLGVLKRSGV